MDRYLINGGNKLSGEIRLNGAKNAALPLIAASCLTADEVILNFVPALDDITMINHVLMHLGISLKLQGSILSLKAANVDNTWAPEHLVGKMRASNLILGPLLARFGHVCLPYPGGCAIGSRPMDYHLLALKALGAEVYDHGSYIEAKAGRLKGAKICFDFPSVGATENALMAACLADGETIIVNAAREPEIIDLANLLSQMGAKIKGAGQGTIYIDGVKKLHGTEYDIMPDRIEAGTLLLMTAACGGDILLSSWQGEHNAALIKKLAEAGFPLIKDQRGIRLIAHKRPLSTDIRTMPYPGFPTDLQPQFMALMALADNVCVIRESVFEDRFHHVPWLKRLGADIRIHGECAVIKGQACLHGARLEASDLRAGAALVMAALAAHGISEIENIHHIDRGYQDLALTLRSLGADIIRIGEADVKQRQSLGYSELCLVGG